MDLTGTGAVLNGKPERAAAPARNLKKEKRLMEQLRQRLEQWEADVRQELDRQEDRLRERIEERLSQHIHELIARIMPDALVEQAAETES